MRRMNRFLSLTTALLFFWLGVRGQAAEYRARILPVKQSGYYRILLPPAVVGRLNADKTDIRIYDGKNQEIPYLLTQEQPGQKTQFKDYELVTRITSKTSTKLVLRNATKSPINSLGLLIKNTNIRKKARLSGSNDAKTWYGIEDDYLLEPVASSQTTSEAKILDFPLSDYEYYQLEINDSLSAPLNILKAGYYETIPEAGTYSEIPGLSFTQIDSSDHRSYVHIRFQTPARPDKLTLAIQAPSQYRRSAELVQRRIRTGRRGRKRIVFETLRAFELNSQDSLHTVYLPALQTEDLYVLIDNQNNIPLTIGSLKAQQLTTYLLAELKPGGSYHLSFASPGVGAPAYDLVYFKNKIPDKLPIIQVTNVGPVLEAQMITHSFFSENRWLIWVAIGLVLILLSYFSYQMVTDMKNR
ncbi:hypothetical protein GCM10028803_41710 [Larkinella knui]|uniref:DUF3999 family protein n=1 Tax=Larkinella knui TaxID=2025310 RepID=A0A3P1CN94_9BACT|nr:DUF3999 domain-containing protein [Larkinella knui]RRB14803.1 hypothetical protein EHT87_09540 [Larkinella knui]